MPKKEILKKQIVYRSTHRGTKEMDLLLGSFVKEYIDNFNENELLDLEKLLFIEDDIISKWYFENVQNHSIQKNKISKLLKKFKL